MKRREKPAKRRKGERPFTLKRKWSNVREDRNVGMCADANKRMYLTEVDCLASNWDMSRKPRAYVCRFCGRWHLTSQRPEHDH